jgi:hypothetical protein
MGSWGMPQFGPFNLCSWMYHEVQPLTSLGKNMFMRTTRWLPLPPSPLPPRSTLSHTDGRTESFQELVQLHFSSTQLMIVVVGSRRTALCRSPGFR